MNSQPSNKRKQQPSSFPSFRIYKQRAAIWFTKFSFFRFKMKSGLNHPHSPSRSSSKTNSSLSSDPSVSCAQSPSTTTSKDSINASTSVSNQTGVATSTKKKSSKMRKTLDAVSSKFKAAPTTTQPTRPIHSTAPQTTTQPDYRQSILPFYFDTMIPMVPGVC